MQNGNLLVTSFNTAALLELSADNGESVREISLQADIEDPRHGVQLANGQFVVCHGWRRTLDQVCMVDDHGRVISSYRHVYAPVHLAVDEESQFLYVADMENNTVALLNSTLMFVRDIGERLSNPHRLYLDQTTRLFVGELDGGISVIQL